MRGRVLLLLPLVALGCDRFGSSGGDEPAEISPTQDASVAKDASVGRRVFTTTGLYRGNFGGLDQADTKCNDEAERAGLPRVFKAWLSTAASPAATRLAAGSGPFVRTDSKAVGSSLTNTVLAPLNVDAKGGPIKDPVNVWTGTMLAGGAAPANCDGWTSSASSARGAAGQMTATSESWTFNSVGLSCANDYRLYCIEDAP